jgi:tetratricopeptide (TPR) repeat protein
MRQAVFSRNLGAEDSLKDLHRVVADHLELLPSDDRLRERELIYHFLGAADFLRAARYYSSDLGPSALDFATRMLARIIVEDTNGSNVLSSLLSANGLTLDEVGRLCHQFIFPLHEALLSQASVLQSLNMLRLAQQHLRTLSQTASPDSTWLHDLTASCFRISDLLYKQGRLSEALAELNASLPEVELRMSEEPNFVLWPFNLAQHYSRIGKIKHSMEDLKGALDAHRRSLGLLEELAQSNPKNVDWWLQQIAFSEVDLGIALVSAGDYVQALETHQKSHTWFHQHASKNPEDRWTQSYLAQGHRHIGRALRALRRYSAALSEFQKALPIAERVAASEPDNSEWTHLVADLYQEIGETYEALGQKPEAIAATSRSVRLTDDVSLIKPDDRHASEELAFAHARVGDQYKGSWQKSKSMSSYRASVEIFEELLVTDPGNTYWLRSMMSILSRNADALAAYGKRAEAMQEYDRAIEIMGRLTSLAPENVRWQRDLLHLHKQMMKLCFASRPTRKGIAGYLLACMKVIINMFKAIFIKPNATALRGFRHAAKHAEILRNLQQRGVQLNESELRQLRQVETLLAGVAIHNSEFSKQSGG